MRNLKQWALGTVAVTLLCALVAPAAAQEEEKKQDVAVRVPAVAYKIDFLLHEVEGGKRVNTREYSMLLRDGRRGSIRIGTRVPITIGDGKGVQYMDVGFNLDCSLRPAGNALEFEYNVEVSSLVTPDGSPQATAVTPVLRSFRSGSTTLVTPGKPMLVSVVDELTTKRQLQIEATITKVQ
jgi:hypothetical protein